MSKIDLQPTLIGEHVIVRPLRADDWSAMFAAASDPMIWEAHPASDRYIEPVFRAFFDAALKSKSAFAFIDRATGAIIGSSRYSGFDPAHDEIEIRWTFLAGGYWGGAFNREIKGLMIEHAFAFVETVIFRVGETNLRSRGAMKKIGGVLREDSLPRTLNGVIHDHVVYEVRRDSWRHA